MTRRLLLRLIACESAWNNYFLIISKRWRAARNEVVGIIKKSLIKINVKYAREDFSCFGACLQILRLRGPIKKVIE